MYQRSSVAGVLCSKSRECPKSKSPKSRDYCTIIFRFLGGLAGQKQSFVTVGAPGSAGGFGWSKWGPPFCGKSEKTSDGSRLPSSKNRRLRYIIYPRYKQVLYNLFDTFKSGFFRCFSATHHQLRVGRNKIPVFFNSLSASENSLSL